MIYKIFDKQKQRFLNDTYEHFYEADHIAINLNWDTGNWGVSNERYIVEEVKEESEKVLF